MQGNVQPLLSHFSVQMIKQNLIYLVLWGEPACADPESSYKYQSAEKLSKTIKGKERRAWSTNYPSYQNKLIAILDHNTTVSLKS